MILEKENSVRQFAFRLRTVVPFFGFASYAIKLLFLKYMSDFHSTSSDDDFRAMLAYKNMFTSKEFNANIASYVFNMAEKKYKIEIGLLVKTIDSLQKIFVEKQEYIFEILNDMEIPKSKKDMVEFLEAILDYNENKDVTKTNFAMTNASLLKLVRKILDVKKDEIYMDSFAGFSRSSFDIDAKKYLGYEINEDVAAISNMLMILSGKKKFKISNQDYFLSDDLGVADKVFTDGPLGLTLSQEEYDALGGKSKRGEYHMLRKTINCLRPGGTGVVVCTGGMLFSQLFKDLREELTFTYLKAVISLPPLCNYINVPVYLVVLKKDKKGDNIIMINANQKKGVVKTDKRTTALSDEIIEKIMFSLNGNIIPGFSNSITLKDILCKNQSWLPTHYIEKNINVNYRSSKEVEIELNQIYDDLFKLLRK